MFQAVTPEHLAQARTLFLEYASSLGFSLCFQGFEQEMVGLPGDYAPPQGRLLLARLGQESVGCVALHPLQPGTCEMKRLYVRPQFRGHGVRKALLNTVLAEARAIGYRRMRLDSVEPVMQDAVRMYRAYGFREIAPYRENPIPGALYMELILDRAIE